MTDLNVFTICHLGRNLFGFSDRTLAQHLSEKFQIPVTEQDVDRILQHPPKTKYLVQALRDLGFSPQFIAHYLSISQPTVSYHLNTMVPKPYVNTYWHSLLMYWQTVNKSTTNSVLKS